jgi:hypothetical protein
MDNATIRKMTQQERLQTMEILWDAIIHDQNEPTSPSWHEEILSARRAKIEAGTASYITLDEMKAGK